MTAPAGIAKAPSGLLAQIPYFVGLGSSTLTEIGRTVRRRAFAAGETILTEGKPCEGLYYVIEGQVRLIRGCGEGREYVLRVLGAGATFNDVAVFDGGPNSDGAVAVGPTTVGFIPKANMMVLIDRHPQVAKAALKLLSSPQRTLGSDARGAAASWLYGTARAHCRAGTRCLRTYNAPGNRLHGGFCPRGRAARIERARTRWGDCA